MSEDPIGFRGGVNFYPYVTNRPTVLNDPLGLWASGVGAGISGIIAIPGAGGIAGKVTCFAVTDSHLNAGLLCCGGLGPAVGGGAAVSGQGSAIACLTCKTICDMEGTSIQLQVFGALGEGASGGVGVSMSKKNVSVMVSAGPAGGGGAGAAAIIGECKLVLGRKGCRACALKSQ